MGMIRRIRKDEAITRAEFDSALKAWFDGANPGEWVGDRGGRGQAPWIFVRDLGRVFHLNADSNREGVREYLGMLTTSPNLEWTVVLNRNGTPNKVAFGPDQRTISGFYLYVVRPR